MEYLKDLNGTQAAIRAGYSAKTANEQAAQILVKLSIQNKLKELMDARSERLEITADQVLREFAKIAFSNVQDFTDSSNGVVNVNGVDVDKSAAIQSIEVIKKTFGEENKREIIFTKLKLYDKLRALDSIAKHIGFFEKDNEQLRKTDEIDYSKLSDAALKEIVNQRK